MVAVIETSNCPFIRSDFERDVIDRVITLVRAMSDRCAIEVAGLILPGSHSPAFTIRPHSARAAQLSGHVIGTDLYLRIGPYAEHEFFSRRQDVVRQARNLNEMEAVWGLVVAGGISEQRWTVDSNVRWAEISINVGGKSVVFAFGGRLLASWRAHEERTIVYDAYDLDTTTRAGSTADS